MLESLSAYHDDATPFVQRTLRGNTTAQLLSNCYLLLASEWHFHVPSRSRNISFVLHSVLIADRQLKILFTLIYVLPFYLFRATRPSPVLNRDAPAVISARIRTVSLTCLISTLSTIYLIHHQSTKPTNTTVGTLSSTLHLLGYYPLLHPFTTVTTTLLNPLLLTFLLFLGPLFETLLLQRSYQHWFSSQSPNSLITTLRSSIGFRNYIAGPLTEEILFRSVVIPLHLLAKVSATKIVFLTPLYFGIAHLHRCYEFTLTHPHTPTLPLMLGSLFQFGYTTLFGWYAAFLYLRTGSLLVVILVHSFCNWCGLPRVWGRVEAGEPLVTPVPVSVGAYVRGKDDDGDNVNPVQEVVGREGEQWAIGWTVAYYVLLFAGAYGFTKGLWTMTESSSSLASFEDKMG